MERKIEIYPSFDRRDPDPSKNYGIHNCDIAFYLIGKRGAYQFKALTGWFLPHVRKELKCKASTYVIDYPRGFDIGYHAHEPQHEGQEPMTGDCPIIGGTCYYDGSSLQAEAIAEAMVAEGSDAVWKIMEKYYIWQFGELE